MRKGTHRKIKLREIIEGIVWDQIRIWDMTSAGGKATAATMISRDIAKFIPNHYRRRVR